MTQRIANGGRCTTFCVNLPIIGPLSHLPVRDSGHLATAHAIQPTRLGLNPTFCFSPYAPCAVRVSVTWSPSLKAPHSHVQGLTCKRRQTAKRLIQIGMFLMDQSEVTISLRQDGWHHAKFRYEGRTFVPPSSMYACVYA